MCDRRFHKPCRPRWSRRSRIRHFPKSSYSCAPLRRHRGCACCTLRVKSPSDLKNVPILRLSKIKANHRTRQKKVLTLHVLCVQCINAFAQKKIRPYILRSILRWLDFKRIIKVFLVRAFNQLIITATKQEKILLILFKREIKYKWLILFN